MENKNVKEFAETLSASLDNTQKNATDTEKAVQQILSLSGKEIHEQTVTAILEDSNLNMAEKLDLIHRENESYDEHEGKNTDRVVRLQTEQTKNVGSASTWWSENWGWVLLIGVTTCIAAGTPGGRAALSSVAKRLAA